MHVASNDAIASNSIGWSPAHVSLCNEIAIFSFCLLFSVRWASAHPFIFSKEPFFSVSCPGFGLILGANKCTGCPWTRINATALSRIGAPEFLLKPINTFFDKATKTCNIARIVRGFNTRKHVFNTYIAHYLYVIYFVGGFVELYEFR